MLGEGPSPAPPPTEARVVESASMHLSQAPEHLVAPIREVLLQPFGEQVLHRERQPQQHHARAGRSRLAGRRQDLRQLMVVQPRDQRSHVHAHRNPRIRQRPHRRQPAGGNRRSRLHHPVEVVAQGRDRQRDHHRPMLRHAGQDVEVPHHQVVLGDDRHWMSALEKHLQAGTRDPQPPLHRLIGIGDAAQSERLRLPGASGQRLLQQFGGVGLHHDPALEVEPRGEAEVLVRRSRVAVAASVLAATVGVQADREAQVRARVAGDDAPGPVGEEAGPGSRPILTAELRFRLRMQPLETVGRIAGGSTASNGQSHGMAGPPGFRVPVVASGCRTGVGR